VTTEPVRAVLFDAGNTLVFVDPDRMIRILDTFGVAVEPEAFAAAELDARLALTRRLDGDAETTGTESHVWREYFGTILQACRVPREKLVRVGEEVRRVHATDHLWTHVPEGTHAALAALREAGLRLGVVSNADGRVPELLDRLGIGEQLEFVLDSGRVGVEKPDPRIFQAAVRRLGLPAGACLFAGDLYPVDVQGARRAGLRAVLIDPWDAFGDRDVDRVLSVAEVPGYVRRLGGG
jgi:putative hydrolase of the HAD superfamily